MVKYLDLASLKTVRRFALDVVKNEPRLDILINNAGCTTYKKEITEDGLEYQMQANYFGHFLFTILLLGLFFQLIDFSNECLRFNNLIY